MSLEKKLVTPQSLLIEKTALDLAAVFFEAGRSAGLTSKYANPKLFAKANLEKFIPKAVELLMDMLGSPAISNDQKDLIYNAILERSNDKELSNIGIPVFENPFEWTSDQVVPQKPIIANSPKLDDVLKPKPYIKGMN